MKMKFRILFITAFLVTAPLFMFAQSPPHPNNGNAPGGTNNPVGGGAPISNGTFILITLAVAYAARKLQEFSKTARERKDQADPVII